MLSAIKRTEQKLSKLYLERVGERNALLAFYFHGLFRDDKQAASGLVDPLEGTTIPRFRQFVEHFISHGYSFVTPDDLIAGLDPHDKYAMITFDDGYANNQRALPILAEFKIPATFFIATGNVHRGQSFWWDVVYRERARRGVSSDAIKREQESLKQKKYFEIEKYLAEQFGADASKPHGDLDRPFTCAELKLFAQNQWVAIGNHTRDHAILDLYSADEIRAQIAQAQNDLREITGRTPIAIAYPNGRYNKTVLQIARQVGLRVGFTVVPQKNRVPIDLSGESALRLPRFYFSRKWDIQTQCEMARSDVLFYRRVRNWFKSS